MSNAAKGPQNFATCFIYLIYFDFPSSSDGKASVYNAGDLGSIPGLGRFPGEGNGNPLQYSCLENPMDRGACCRLLSMGSQRIGHDGATPLSLFQHNSRLINIDLHSFLFFFA